MPLRALFFDFDGLIVDTESPEVEIWQEIFAEHGLEFPDENWMNSIGRGADQIAEKPLQLLTRLLDGRLDPAVVDADYRRRVTRRIEEMPVLPGVVELAREARSAGIPAWVVSSSYHAWVDGHLARLGIAGLFDRTVCREDAARAKPFPDLYLKACELAGVEPCDAVALEDSVNGLEAANAAGLLSVAVPNKLTARLDLSHAHCAIASLEELSVDILSIWLRAM
jgi:HAD superfamily hydrolase (TIGR01509 family)